MGFKKFFVLSVMVAASVVCGQSGTTGPLTWSIEDGTLTISGEGAMPNYDWNGTSPWHQYRNSFTIAIIEDGVTTIGDWAFSEYAALTSVTIGNSVTTIGRSAFLRTGLTEITIPNSVTTIGGSAFSILTLTVINVDSENLAFSSDDGVLFNKEKTTLIVYPRGKQGTSYTIPNSVTTIGNSAFDGTRLTSVIIPNSVTAIGDYAFMSVRLTSVTIPNSVITIGAYAFYVTDLTEITIPNSVTIIGDEAFSYCRNLTAINVSSESPAFSSEDGVLFNKEKTTLMQYPQGKQGTSYTIPNSVITIGEGAFGGTRLTSVTIGSSVTTIGDRAFSRAGLTSVTNYANIPQTITSGVFDGMPLSDITLYVPHQSVELYRTADVWRDFGNIVGVDDETSIRNNRQTRDNRHGILLKNAIVSDLAKISVVTPEQAMVNLAILDNLGNVVFSADGVGAGFARPENRTNGDLGGQTPPLQNAIVWNLTNQSGRFVANGAYLIIVEATGISGRRFTYSSRIGVNR